MGLDQSFFTNSKAIAQAIFGGNIENEDWWNDAFFSIRNIEGKPGWTYMDFYAKNRLSQYGLVPEMSLEDVPSIDTAAYTYFPLVSAHDHMNEISPEDRQANLKMVEFLGAMGIEQGGQTLWQIGIFRKFNALEGWFRR